MNFESLMKVIEDEVNKIDYNSDIILTNTTTGKKLIIPKETPKPTNFFNIPYDIRSVIYNKVRDLKKFDKYELLESGNLQYASVYVMFNLRRPQKKIEEINFIDSDDEEEENFIDSDDENEDEDEEQEEEEEENLETCQKKLMDLLKKIDENKGEIKERITGREVSENWRSKNELRIIVKYNFIYDKRKKYIDHIITEDILNNEYNLIKYKSYFEIYDDDRDEIDEGINHIDNDKLFDYLKYYNKEFSTEKDENFIKLEDEFNNEKKKINNEFADTYGEYLGKQAKMESLLIDYNRKFKKLFFEKIKSCKNTDKKIILNV